MLNLDRTAGKRTREPSVATTAGELNGLETGDELQQAL